MNKLQECLNNGGDFSVKRYMASFDCIPSIYALYLDEDLNLKDVKEDTFKNLFNHDFCYRTSDKCLYKTSIINSPDPEISDSGVYFIGSLLSVIIENRKIVIYYSPKDYQTSFIRDLGDIILNKIPYQEDINKSSKVQLVTYSNYYDTVESEIKSTTVDIKKNYNNDFLPVYNKLVDFIHQRESGIVLLSGICGAGKTTLIKHLITHEESNYLFITPTIATNMGNPNFVGFLMENKNSIFIMEDCEQLLQERTTNSWSTSLANILNMTDGILSDIFNIKFICTFNAPETTIDPALLREGRCFVNYKFDKLKADKVAILNKENNLGIPEDEICDMTLAELYNYQGKKETKKKIGF